jgi:hypothetical protein
MSYHVMSVEIEIRHCEEYTSNKSNMDDPNKPDNAILPSPARPTIANAMESGNAGPIDNTKRPDNDYNTKQHPIIGWI